MRHSQLLAVLVALSIALHGAQAAKGKKPDVAQYQQAADAVASNVNKAAEKSEQLVNEHMSAVNKDPGALITKDTMKNMMAGRTFLPQKAGSRTVSVQANQGFNGLTNYQPSGWKITETMSGPTDKKDEPTAAKEPVYTYPMGLGPVLMNQCTERSYEKSSPCYNSKLFDLQNKVCQNQIDAANYIGVGFDGRGYYNAQSRKASLVQRSCANRATFMGQDIPDTMNIFGIFETVAETKSFQSASQYMRYIRHKAGLSNQKNLFSSEASKYSKGSSFGANLGGIGAIVGGAIGAVAGGPAGAGMGAQLGGAIGGSIGGGSGSGSGNSKSKQKGQSSSKMMQSEKAKARKGSAHSFFAIMYVNVILYDISLDEIKPNDVSLNVLKDYMNLPASYYSIGADVKYQNFLLRWGTHFIRSGKFGGQLKITKTSKTSKIQSQEQFARIAETEFQSMFATLQSSYTQKSSGWSFLGFGSKKRSTSQKSSAKSKAEHKSTMSAGQSQSDSSKQSQFTQTTVEAQGGTPEIAEALVDFYTPAFKQLYHDWLVSIKDYAKPFEFQLRAVDEIFNMNMDDLFPGGKVDFGCVGGDSSKVKILVEPETNRRYYIDVRTKFDNSSKFEQKVKVYCKYSHLEDFKEDLNKRRISLERAIGVYMAEGPFPTSSFELKAGEPGCEEATLGTVSASMASKSRVMSYAELKKSPFLIAFDLPQPVPNLIPMKAKYRIIFKDGIWFATEPTQTSMHLYDGCEISESTEARICFRNIMLNYDEKTGLLRVDPRVFPITKSRIPSLPEWLSGSIVARAHRLEMTKSIKADVFSGRAALPCNIRWLNSHRLDPKKQENCIHFTAASEGDIFVIFSAIPKDHTTWYYLQINSEGVSFYQGLKLRKRDVQKGMGILGDKNLFQSFFVCVIQNSGTVMMQYGKADPESEVGTVFSGYTFARDSQFSRLSFYTFGSGSKEVSLMDIRLTRTMPKVECLSKNYKKVKGHCVLKCHAECINCDAANDNKACHQCKNVRVETGKGAIKVIECLSKCPAGKYVSQTKKRLCVPCLAGTFKSGKGNEKCASCPAGSFSSAGATKCSKCKPGTFNAKPGQSKCTKCSGGTFSGKGATVCQKCPVGSFSGEGQQKCSPCPYGHYGDSQGLKQCKPCSRGFSAAKRGQVKCTKCPAGTSSVEGSRTCSNSCKKGEYSPAKGQPCKKCSPGTFSESAGSMKCSQCAPGSYQPNGGQSVCIKAPKGTYVSQRGAKSYQSCPAGTVNSQVGQANSSACRKCPAGTFSSSATSCKKCPVGQFSPGSGSRACSRCPKGQYAPVEGMKGCKHCDLGTYAPNEGSAVCKIAPQGTYVSNKGSIRPIKCPAGHYNAKVRQSSSSACLPCQKNYFASSSGSSKCRKCSAGSVTAKTGSTRCASCPAGSYAHSSGSCQYCSPGTYISSTGAASCSKCKAGTFAPGRGSRNCRPCSAGSFSNAGSSRCTQCSLGYYAPSSGSSRCMKCPYGSIATNAQRTKCYKFGECYFANKNFVSTSVSRTKSSKPCQSWTVRYCSWHTLKRTCHVPNPTAKASQSTGNTCRTFTEQGGSNKPWCYTKTSTRWETCNIPLCGPRLRECYKKGTKNFVSGIAVTQSGKPCQGWEIKSCPSGTVGKTCHVPNTALKLARLIGNTCRITTASSEKRPWCYTRTSRRWETCNIPQC
ncbi:hypothetical protein BOX15_Mlig022132g2 [Macrostomum lignano]|uniref:MACPF domain-containing protein n=1 Tax=Macrostomum lignano TaxID=282301 RepID=A0A267E1U5_9PLAT|nr:hypothetical protein BOX15_Mlig022132g2 [Macrostomum lignano]